MSLRSDIEEQRKELIIDTSDFSEINLHQYEDILKNIWKSFTKLGHQAKNNFWINHHIENAVSHNPTSEDEVIKILKDIIPLNDKYWFIGQETKNECPKYWLYEGSLASIISILDNMYLFDFYIVDKKYKWIISEEHHGIIVGTGEPIKKKLLEYKLNG